jgi:hypothetical protein
VTNNWQKSMLLSRSCSVTDATTSCIALYRLPLALIAAAKRNELSLLLLLLLSLLLLLVTVELLLLHSGRWRRMTAFRIELCE